MGNVIEKGPMDSVGLLCTISAGRLTGIDLPDFPPDQVLVGRGCYQNIDRQFLPPRTGAGLGIGKTGRLATPFWAEAPIQTDYSAPTPLPADAMGEEPQLPQVYRYKRRERGEAESLA